MWKAQKPPGGNAGRRLAVIAAFGDRVEHGKQFRLQHPAAEGEGILARGMRQLVDERFEIDRIVIGVHAAPKAGEQMRVAHRVIDQNVRHIVAEGALRTIRRETLEDERVEAVLPSFEARATPAIDCPEMRMCRPTRAPEASSAPVILHCVTG